MKKLVKASLLVGLVFSPARTQTPVPTGALKSSAAGSPSDRFRTFQMAQRESRYFQLVWGIDSPNVKLLESGELVRFSYYVLDPEKAKPLNNVKLQPELQDPQKNVKLVVPQLEKVGMLRQSSTPEAGKAYWMAFSNRGRVVKRGDRVNVVIGSFHAEGLVVE
jgi:hypothetical protein